MKITHVNNSLFAQVAVFVVVGESQTIENDQDEQITSIDLPVSKNETDFGNGNYACVRRTDNIYNAVRFWRDASNTVYYVAHPNLDDYDTKKEVPLIRQANDSRVNLKLHVINSDQDFANRQIGIVGEMVVDIATED